MLHCRSSPPGSGFSYPDELPSAAIREEKPGGKLLVNGMVLDREDARKGRVLYDYDATNEDEMTVSSEQVGGTTGLIRAGNKFHLRCKNGIMHYVVVI